MCIDSKSRGSVWKCICTIFRPCMPACARGGGGSTPDPLLLPRNIGYEVFEGHTKSVRAQSPEGAREQSSEGENGQISEASDSRHLSVDSADDLSF